MSERHDVDFVPSASGCVVDDGRSDRGDLSSDRVNRRKSECELASEILEVWAEDVGSEPRLHVFPCFSGASVFETGEISTSSDVVEPDNRICDPVDRSA